MKKWMIVSIIVVGALGLGVGGAYAYNKTNPVSDLQTGDQGSFPTGSKDHGFWGRNSWPQGQNGNGLNSDENQQPGQNDQPFGQNNSMPGSNNQQPGMNNQSSDQSSTFSPGVNSNSNQDGQAGGGMMGNGQTSNATPGTTTQSTNSEHITLDVAVTKANAYLQNLDKSLKISEVMEFENNFYVVASESDSGRGAMELLVDPYSGVVSQEMGANRMWNLKYGTNMMITSSASDSTLTLDQAISVAKDSLAARTAKATLNEDGIRFYGYYTFDYSVDGKISGMLSVNGLNGSVLFHTWHGAFISEKEF
jgi:hypothetical protein